MVKGSFVWYNILEDVIYLTVLIDKPTEPADDDDDNDDRDDDN